MSFTSKTVCLLLLVACLNFAYGDLDDPVDLISKADQDGGTPNFEDLHELMSAAMRSLKQAAAGPTGEETPDLGVPPERANETTATLTQVSDTFKTLSKTYPLLSPLLIPVVFVLRIVIIIISGVNCRVIVILLYELFCFRFGLWPQNYPIIQVARDVPAIIKSSNGQLRFLLGYFRPGTPIYCILTAIIVIVDNVVLIIFV